MDAMQNMDDAIRLAEEQGLEAVIRAGGKKANPFDIEWDVASPDEAVLLPVFIADDGNWPVEYGPEDGIKTARAAAQEYVDSGSWPTEAGDFEVSVAVRQIAIGFVEGDVVVGETRPEVFTIPYRRS